MTPKMRSVWTALDAHALMMRDVTTRAVFEENPTRLQNMVVTLPGLRADFSRQIVLPETLRLLMDLYQAADIPRARAAMFGGDTVNASEQQAALHTALRRQPRKDEDEDDLFRNIRLSDERMLHFAEEIRAGRVAGHTGKPITDIVHFGIGGSDLGPRMVLSALSWCAQGPRIHFVSNADGHELFSVLKILDPETTLFLIASKSFTTAETLLNAKSAWSWAEKQLGASPAAHFVAMTAAPEKAGAFGVPEVHIFNFSHAVGGRFSIWSPIGLPIAIHFGREVFEGLLAGAYTMDRHFALAPPERNIPVLAALVGIWNRNFLNLNALAIIPYDQRLDFLPQYLQQLEMESNGKSFSRSGAPLSYKTAPILFGQAGTNCQHSFFQMIHQGTERIALDLIAVKRADHNAPTHHRMLLSNFLAQVQALSMGDPDRGFPGGRPLTSYVLEHLTPQTLGMLIALYEHKVFCQGAIWDINSFDQPGVELGKQLAVAIEKALRENNAASLDQHLLIVMDLIK